METRRYCCLVSEDTKALCLHHVFGVRGHQPAVVAVMPLTNWLTLVFVLPAVCAHQTGHQANLDTNSSRCSLLSAALANASQSGSPGSPSRSTAPPSGTRQEAETQSFLTPSLYLHAAASKPAASMLAALAEQSNLLPQCSIQVVCSAPGLRFRHVSLPITLSAS